MNDDDPILAGITASCTALVTRLYAALDEHACEALDRVFAPDATWVRLGQRTDGLPAIRQLMQQRPTDLATCHVITNALLTEADRDTATGRFLMLVVRKAGVSDDDARPLPVAGPWRLSALHVRFVRTPDGWRIAEQRTEPQFEFTSGVTP